MQTLLLLLCGGGWVLSEPLGEAQRMRGDGFMSYAGDFTQDYEPYVYAAVPLHPPMPVLHVISPKPLAPPKRDIHHGSSKKRPMYAKPAFTHSDDVRHTYSQSEFVRPSYDQYERPFEYAGPSYAESDYAGPSYTHSEYVKPTFAESYAESLYSPRPDSHLSLAETNFLPLTRPSSVSQLTYAKPQHHRTSSYPVSQESAPTILYAKPTAHGGYSYNKEPTKKRKGSAPKKYPKKESPMIIRLHRYRVTRNR